MQGDIEPIHSAPYYVRDDGQLIYVKGGDLLNPPRFVKSSKERRNRPAHVTFYVNGERQKIPLSRLVAGYFSEVISTSLWLLIRGSRTPWIFPSRFRVYRVNTKKGYEVNNLRIVEK